MTDILDRRLKPSTDAIASAVGDEIVILHLKKSAYYGLDAVGTRIWALLNERMTPRDICARLSDEYEVPSDTVGADVRRFLTELEAQDMLSDA